MSFDAFLNEAITNKHVKPAQIIELGKVAFGLLAVPSRTGRGDVDDLVDLSQLKPYLDKTSKKVIFKLLVKAGKEIGLDLVPVEGTDASGFIPAGPGGEDCILLKVKGNIFAGNDPDGDLESDIALAFDQYTLGSGI